MYIDLDSGETKQFEKDKWFQLEISKDFKIYFEEEKNRPGGFYCEIKKDNKQYVFDDMDLERCSQGEEE